MNQESEALIRLGKLLRRRRSPEHRRAVEEILSSTVSSSEKVRRVTEIDRKACPGDQNSREPRRHYVGTPEDNAADRLVRARKPPSVKAPLTRQGYFAFLFRARLRIREFGRTTHTIEAGGFPPSVRLSPDVAAFFSGFVKPSAQDICVILARLMDNAWMHLTKRDYNLLVLLLDFCRTIEQTALTAEDFRANRSMAMLRSTEDKLLALRLRTGLPPNQPPPGHWQRPPAGRYRAHRHAARPAGAPPGRTHSDHPARVPDSVFLWRPGDQTPAQAGAPDRT